MIVKAEKSKLKTGYPGRNVSRIGMIRSLAFTDQSFYFDNETAFEDQDEWFEAIKAGDIMVLNDLKEVSPDSEQQKYIKSVQDYEYPGFEGKYVYTFQAIWEKQYQDYIESLSGQDLRVFISDINNHVHADKYGDYVRGFDVEMINVEPKKLPGNTQPAWAIIRLVLSDPTEHDLATWMEWNPNKFNLVHVTLSDISGAANYLDFTIKDSIFDIPIDYLYIGDVSIVDNAGGITPVLLREKGCGQYRITGSSTLSYGTLSINSNRFYGSGQYFVNEDTVIFNNFAWESRTKFQVDVRLSGSLDLYSGLVLADFALADDLIGAISINSVTEVSTGRYELTVASNLTEGDMSVDDGTVTGTGAFDVDIAVTITNLVSVLEYETRRFTCDITTVISGLPVTGLDTSDFSLVDTYNGTIGISALTETAPGTYELTLDTAMTTGIQYVNDIYYSGSALYAISNATVINGGAADTTDFINDVAGLAERFHVLNPTNATPEIISGVYGFTGNLQTLKHDAGTLPVGIYTYASYFKTGVDYKLRFKLHTVSAGTGPDRFVTFQVYGSDVFLSEQCEDITAYSDIIESETFQVPPGESYLLIQWVFNRVGMYIYIDSIELVEV